MKLLGKLENFYQSLESQKVDKYNSLDDTIEFLRPQRQTTALTLATFQQQSLSSLAASEERRFKLCSSKYSQSSSESSVNSRQSKILRPNKIITKKHKFNTQPEIKNKR